MDRDRRGRAGAEARDVAPPGAPPGHPPCRWPRRRVLLATSASAAFWAWFAGSPLLFALMVLPVGVAAFVSRDFEPPTRDPLTVWTLAFTTGGTLAALALWIRALER